MKLSDFSTLTFDCYGTLIDWESGIYDALENLLSPQGLSLYQKLNLYRDEALEIYSKHESRIQHENPTMAYKNLLANTYAAIAEELDVPASAEDCAEFSSSIRYWPAFLDTVISLRYLKQHYKLVILSNVDKQGFAMSQSHLKVEFDEVFVAEEIGSYKPSLNNFHYMLDKLEARRIHKTDILHTAQSLYHDMVPATQVGLARCWIDRRNDLPGPGATPAVDEPIEVNFHFDSLSAMVEAHKIEIQST